MAGWPAIFLINVPVAAAVIAIAWRFVDESMPGQQSLDWTGATLATLALGMLTWALTLWSSSYAMTPAVRFGLILGLLMIGTVPVGRISAG